MTEMKQLIDLYLLRKCHAQKRCGSRTMWLSWHVLKCAFCFFGNVGHTGTFVDKLGSHIPDGKKHSLGVMLILVNRWDSVPSNSSLVHSAIYFFFFHQILSFYIKWALLLPPEYESFINFYSICVSPFRLYLLNLNISEPY